MDKREKIYLTLYIWGLIIGGGIALCAHLNSPIAVVLLAIIGGVNSALIPLYFGEKQ